MKKKMLNLSAIVLTLCLLIGALPLSVSAAESYSVTFEYDYTRVSRAEWTAAILSVRTPA